ncbi:MAG: universal stress protein [Methanosarcinaceae archaeon]|nr:universal stress protein [Methanosarcinaceae archaeon]
MVDYGHARTRNVDMVIIGALKKSADGRYLMGSIADTVICNFPLEVPYLGFRHISSI